MIFWDRLAAITGTVSLGKNLAGGFDSTFAIVLSVNHIDDLPESFCLIILRNIVSSAHDHSSAQMTVFQSAFFLFGC